MPLFLTSTVFSGSASLYRLFVRYLKCFPDMLTRYVCLTVNTPYLSLSQCIRTWDKKLNYSSYLAFQHSHLKLQCDWACTVLTLKGIWSSFHPSLPWCLKWVHAVSPKGSFNMIIFRHCSSCHTLSLVTPFILTNLYEFISM